MTNVLYLATKPFFRLDMLVIAKMKNLMGDGKPMAQAVIRAIAVNVAKGQHRAQRLFAELLAAAETSRKRLHDEYFEGALTYILQ